MTDEEHAAELKYRIAERLGMAFDSTPYDKIPKAALETVMRDVFADMKALEESESKEAQ